MILLLLLLLLLLRLVVMHDTGTYDRVRSQNDSLKQKNAAQSVRSRDGVLEAVALTSRRLKAGNCWPWP